MCTAFVKKGKDLIYGYNLDVDPQTWNFSLRKTKDYFSVAIKVGSTTYLTHGVNRLGNFGNLPYMNGTAVVTAKGKKRERIDLLVDRLIRNGYSFDDVKNILAEKEVVSIPSVSFHSLLCNAKGEALIVEPGYGCKKVEEDFAVLSNFPLFANLTDFSNPFYGKDRFDVAKQVLSSSNDDFSALDGMELLAKVKQDGRWGTRISFAYSRNENKIYYCLDGNFDQIKEHTFG